VEDAVNNKVVARYVDGRTIKGTTADFLPGKDVIHVAEASAPADAPLIAIRMRELKALFFVKDLVGDPERLKIREFGVAPPSAGRKIKIVFTDGEVLLGSTTGYQLGRPGFFIEPADEGANEQRCYVLVAATMEISFL
jgi:hypothetical protein